MIYLIQSVHPYVNYAKLKLETFKFHVLVCRKSQVPKFFLQDSDMKVSRFLSDSV